MKLRYLCLPVALLLLSVPAYADLVTFSSLGLFTAAAPGLTLETFESGLAASPGGLAICPGPVSSASASACFPAGGLQPGVVYSAVGTDPQIVVLGSNFGAVGNTSKVMGPNAGASTLNMAFAGGVTAVGFDAFPGFTAGAITIQMFTPGDVSLGSVVIPGVLGGSFFGVISTTDLIGRVSVSSAGAPGELIDNLRFGAASSSVPEPASLLLLAAGSAIVIRLKKRLTI